MKQIELELLERTLEKITALPYTELKRRVENNEHDILEIEYSSGKYEIEVQYFWDGGEHTDIRIIGSINLTNSLAAFHPKSLDFIVRPDGTVI